MNGEAVGFLAWFIPLCSFTAGVLIWAIRTRPANKAADEVSNHGHWQRLTDEITRKDAEIRDGHAREAELFMRAMEAEAYVAKLEAIMEGIGENRQDAQLLLAAQRLLEDQRKKRNGGDE